MSIKVLISSVLALLPLIGVAQHISDDQAMVIAESVLGKQVTKVMPAKALQAPSLNASSQITQPFYDIFTGEDGNGFVIVSTDRRAPQVIGYGEGKCDPNNLPPQLAVVLEAEDLLLKGETTLAEHPSWMQRAPRLVDDGDGGKLLKTASWNQGYPYNEKTPTFGEQHALTGCVATAMSIVMKYNEWPSRYTWSEMPLEVSPSTSYPELAQLMADAGDAVYMNYGLDGSGADPNWAGHKLQSEFQYSPDCQYITRANCEKSKWYKTLRGEIEADRVVIYAGGEHAFIIDGYDATGNYHINWGWGGNSDGYFDIEYLETQGVSYFVNSGMVINIEPDRSGKEYSRCFVDYGYFWLDRGKISGCKVNKDADQIKSGESFSFNCYIMNIVPDFDGEAGLALVDEKGVIKEVVAAQTASNLDYPGLPLVTPFTADNISFTAEIKSGYRLQVATRESVNDDWVLVLGTIESPSYLMIDDAKASLSKVNLTVTSDELSGGFGLNGTGIEGFEGQTIATRNYPQGASMVYVVQAAIQPDETIRLTIKGKNPEDTQVVKQQDTFFYLHTLYSAEYDVLIEVLQPGQEDPVDPNNDVTIDGIKYQINEDYATVIGYDPSLGTEITIPAEIEIEINGNTETYPVTEIGDNAFDGTTLERCNIMGDLTRIGERAFASCESLTKVILMYDETPAELHSSAFTRDNTSKIFVNVPIVSYFEYKDADNWGALSLRPLSGTLALNDNIEYIIDVDVWGCDLSYTRTVTTVNWMGVYLPFDINVATAEGTYAILTNVASDGVLEWTTVETGTIEAGTPFIFKPVEAGTITFSNNGVILYSCSVAKPVEIQGHKLEGTFQTKTDMALIHGYALSNGTFYSTTNQEKTLKPYRIFLTVPSTTTAAVRSRINGQEITGIDGVMIDTQEAQNPAFNLQGIPATKDYKGVVIVNGKKIIRK